MEPEFSQDLIEGLHARQIDGCGIEEEFFCISCTCMKYYPFLEEAKRHSTICKNIRLSQILSSPLLKEIRQNATWISSNVLEGKTSSNSSYRHRFGIDIRNPQTSEGTDCCRKENPSANINAVGDTVNWFAAKRCLVQ